VSSNKIGEWVMTELKALDEVAYIRFASVYRQFQDIEAFRKEIDNLKTGMNIFKAMRRLKGLRGCCV
jgi:transcriptional repressor NrdR